MALPRACTDPGVPNWLDTRGHSGGLIQGRWNEASPGPLPTLKLVKLSQLRSHIPADTPVVTLQERETALRECRMGAQFRRKW